jgi:hypothetical protein
MPKNGALAWDAYAPGSAREAVSANAEWAGVGPADASWPAEDYQVDGDAHGCFEEQGEPQLEILEFVLSKADTSFTEGPTVNQVA